VSRQAQKQLQETLDTEQQLTKLLKDNPDILVRYPDLLAELNVPHEAGRAVSLIERQVSVLRDKLNRNDSRMRELMDIARDNQRLAESRQRLAVNLLGAQDLDDVISIVLAELSNELNADHAVIRLVAGEEYSMQDKPEMYFDKQATGWSSFTTMMDNQNALCGRCSEEQKAFLFAGKAHEIASAAVIPLVAGSKLGVIGLGSKDETRFNISMGTEFLTQIGELVSAALAVQLQP